MQHSRSSPCLQALASNTANGSSKLQKAVMKKSVSTNALSDMALDAMKYTPINTVATCAIEYVAQQSSNFKDFASCIASPPDIHEPSCPIKLISSSNRMYAMEEAYNQRFQQLYELIKKRRTSRTTSGVDEKY